MNRRWCSTSPSLEVDEDDDAAARAATAEETAAKAAAKAAAEAATQAAAAEKAAAAVYRHGGRAAGAAHERVGEPHGDRGALATVTMAGAQAVVRVVTTRRMRGRATAPIWRGTTRLVIVLA
ncbi:hypothetical protein QP185_00160 [Sphingomonas aerolata]|uniref:hypothetical protein n=1 Tax=Sphingomonas aerolata TaxID=185951 RepID=UPI002FE3EA50